MICVCGQVRLDGNQLSPSGAWHPANWDANEHDAGCIGATLQLMAALSKPKVILSGPAFFQLSDQRSEMRRHFITSAQAGALPNGGPTA
jgi:hypothetical protein